MKKVIKLEKEMLRKVRNNTYVAKTKCCKCGKKSEYNSRGKNMFHFKNSTNYIDKAPKIWRRRKIVCFLLKS
ncbi:hypothetical protein GOY07_03845 [Wolbachia endosymbiont of Litomosoides sigmodontis]|nr:hypothetical protein [Wolbachia endosymbiont of Litomosoides sigmodontis]QKX03265.1 hypothetical protein GOY07_03845 [Wolbachia endosymbiont of Litomosoides sigmodontis]